MNGTRTSIFVTLNLFQGPSSGQALGAEGSAAFASPGRWAGLMLKRVQHDGRIFQDLDLREMTNA